MTGPAHGQEEITVLLQCFATGHSGFTQLDKSCLIAHKLLGKGSKCSLVSVDLKFHYLASRES